MIEPRRLATTGLVVAACVLLAEHVRRVVVRMAFDYDLILWADDYFMTSMLKLSAGVPVYTRLADANSTVYAPGGPYLHHALLSPWGLETSLLANRVLQQVWLACAVALSTTLVMTLAGRLGSLRDASRSERRVLGALAALVIALGVYTNPVVDSLHPTNLVLSALAGAGLVAAHFDRWGDRRRTVLAFVVGALALLAKQTAGVAVGVAFVWIALRAATGPAWRRVALAGLAGAGPLAAAASLFFWTDGHFKTWGFDVLAAHPYDWWKVRDIYAGYFLLFSPACAALAYAMTLGGALRESAWRRVATVAACYVPLALAALFKTMGGPNNLAVVGWLLWLLGLPSVLGLLAESGATRLHRRGWHFAGALVAVQLALFHPRRRLPDAADFANAKTMCDYAAARTRCGEEVLLGRGAVCLHRGGVSVPRDRMMSIIEATVAGRKSELDFYERLRRVDYDVLIFWMGDMEWGGKELWDILRLRYKPFFTTRGQLEGDFWYHGWQGYVTWPVVYWERIEDDGAHEVSERGQRCDFGGRR